jgi:integrase
MPSIALPVHVHLVRSRGREYYYFHPHRGTKRTGKRVPLPGCPTHPDGTPNAEWWAAYRKLAGEPEPNSRPGTFGALIAVYKASPEWAALAESTRTDWTRYLNVIVTAWGENQVRAVEPHHVLALRDAYADVPPADPRQHTKPLDQYRDRRASADNLLRALSSVLSWSIPRNWRPDNPCDHVKKFHSGEGYPAWPMRAIEHFEKHAPAHLWQVAAFALYTGQRQGDVLSMLRSHISGGEVRVVQEKTRKLLWIPLHRDLRTVMEVMSRTSTHLLTNSNGTPWTQDGFRASWQTEMSRRIYAPLRRHRLVFHGLRKSAVVMLLEAGCTTAEVAAITGQTLQMVEHYAEQVSQRRLGRTAILKWEQAKR